MKGVEDRESEAGYFIPAKLVNGLIVAIFGSLLTISGYMVVWGLNDAAFKARVLTELGYLKARVIEIGEDQDQHEHEHKFNEDRKRP